MSETDPFKRPPEALPEVSTDVLELTRTLQDPVTIDRFRQGWMNELDDPAMQCVGRLDARVEQLSRMYSNDIVSNQRLEQEIQKIRRTLTTQFRDTYKRYKDVTSMLHTLDSINEGKELSIYGKESRDMAGYFTEAAEQREPETQVFIDSKDLVSLSKPVVSINTIGDGEPIAIPVRSFVSAEGFESWEKGRGTQDSIDKIHDYASRDSEIKAINDIDAFVLPDGSVVYKTNNSHRVAAAIARGDETIRFQGNMSVYSLFKIPAALDETSEVLIDSSENF